VGDDIIIVWLAKHSRETDDPNLANNRKEWLGSVVHAKLGELGLCESKHVVTIPVSNFLPCYALSCDTLMN
jgi:hypothetical protein